MTPRQALIALTALWALAAPAFAQNIPNPDPPISVNGAYNATAPTCTSGQGCWLQTDANGNLKTAAQGATANTYIGNVNTQGTKATYRAVMAGGIDAAGALVQIQGSATKTIRITQINITGTLTTGATGNIIVQRYSTATSGGTPVGLTAVPLDSTDAAATAVATGYTTVPTLGTSVGIVDNSISFWSASTAAPPRLIFDYGTRNTKPILLQGTAQFLVIRSVNFASYTGASEATVIEWTEE